MCFKGSMTHLQSIKAWGGGGGGLEKKSAHCNLKQCFHFEGNFPNSRKFWTFPGKFREMKKFQKIPGNSRIWKIYVNMSEKYDFYGLKKHIFFRSLASLAHISIHLVKCPTPKLWTFISLKGINDVQIVNFRGHLTSALGPSSVSGNCNKFQEILEFIPGNLFLSCGNTDLKWHVVAKNNRIVGFGAIMQCLIGKLTIVF